MMASCSIMNSTSVNQEISNDGNDIYHKGKKVAYIENISYVYHKGKKTVGINIIQYQPGFNDDTDLIVEYVANKHPKAKVEITALK